MSQEATQELEIKHDEAPASLTPANGTFDADKENMEDDQNLPEKKKKKTNKKTKALGKGADKTKLPTPKRHRTRGRVTNGPFGVELNLIRKSQMTRLAQSNYIPVLTTRGSAFNRAFQAHKLVEIYRMAIHYARGMKQKTLPSYLLNKCSNMRGFGVVLGHPHHARKRAAKKDDKAKVDKDGKPIAEGAPVKRGRGRPPSKKPSSKPTSQKSSD